MSIYSTGLAAYRDTVKWLVAFVPIGSVVATGTTIGPDLIRSAREAPGAGEWAADHMGALAGMAAVLAGVVTVVHAGALVLGSRPASLADILGRTSDQELDQAFGEGVAAPYFFTTDDFKAEMRKLAGDSPDFTAPGAQRASAASELLREWALYRDTGAAYSRFQWAFAVGIGLVVAGFLLAAIALEPEQPAGLTGAPVPVTVQLTQEAADDLEATAGCPPGEAEFWIVDGSWEQPVLAVDGPSCPLGTRWEPAEGAVELRPAQPRSGG